MVHPPSQPPPPDPDAESRALAGPFRAILAVIAATLATVNAVDLWAGEHGRFAVMLPTLAAVFGAWRLARRGAISRAATVLFYTIAILVTARMWIGGNGLLDFVVATYPAVLFLACIFIPSPLAYGGLAALVLAAVGGTGLLELAGWWGPRPIPLEPHRLANLMVVLGVSALGGRVLTQAVRGAFQRERELTGALRTTEERIEKVFRASHGAIVVSRAADGTIVDVNDAYLRLFGRERGEVLGRTADELGAWVDPAERERFVREVRRCGSQRDFPARLRTRSGEVVETLLSAERIPMEGDEWLLVAVADVTALCRAQERAEFLATRDPLTGLASRVAAVDRLAHAIDRAAAEDRRLALLRIGIDRLKGINESLGHDAGDAVVREAAARLEALARPAASLARMGGDEFLLVLDPLADAGEAIGLAHRVLAAFRAPFAVAGRELRVTCSVGLCAFPVDAREAATLLRYADTALRAAKEAGRDRICAFEPSMNAQARRRVLLENDLRDALREGGLRLAYQPKVDLATGRLVGMEALARWRHAEHGDIAPDQFIAIAEESDLILDLGRWAIESACAQLARWAAEGFAPPPVAVNLSPRQVDAALPGLVESVLARHGVPAGLLEFEVTEGTLIAHPESTRRVLQRLAARGSGIVLDDFGVGYSSLSYVKHLPLDGIKLDRSFATSIENDPRDAAIVKAIVGLAHGLDVRVIAEGIECAEQSATLRAIGCDEGQGWLFSRPLPPEDLAAGWLERCAPGTEPVAAAA